MSLPPSEKDAPLPLRKPDELIITQPDIDLCLGSGELLRCPFCGHWPMSCGEKTPNGRATRWKIICTRMGGGLPSCTASVWWTDPDPEKARARAVEIWNRRPTPAP